MSQGKDSSPHSNTSNQKNEKGPTIGSVLEGNKRDRIEFEGINMVHVVGDDLNQSRDHLKLCLGSKEYVITKRPSTSISTTNNVTPNDCSFKGLMMSKSGIQREPVSLGLIMSRSGICSEDDHIQTLHSMEKRTCRPSMGGQQHIMSKANHGLSPHELGHVIINHSLLTQGRSTPISKTHLNATKPSNTIRPMPNHNLEYSPISAYISSDYQYIRPSRDSINRWDTYGIATQDGEMVQKRKVMVVMEGHPIEDTMCLQDYDSYESFAKALVEKLGNSNGACIPKASCRTTLRDESTVSYLQHAIPGYKIAYEDFEGDLLLVGDLQWRRFIQVAQRIRILPMARTTLAQATSTHSIRHEA